MYKKSKEDETGISVKDYEGAVTISHLNPDISLPPYPGGTPKSVFTQGLRVGMKIYAINRKSMNGVTSQDAAQLIKDAEGQVHIIAEGIRELDAHKNDRSGIERGMRIIPPTLLHFEIILEAYMGYSLSEFGEQHSYYHNSDTSIPRAAVMGGAVVATLTAYQDEIVVNAFKESGLFVEDGISLQVGDDYWNKKTSLLKSLHTHFIYKNGDNATNSKFAEGDVDIFLQASPLTRGIARTLHDGGISDRTLLSIIGSYVGNAGICEGDLGRYTTNVMNKAVTAPIPGSSYNTNEAEFAYTVSKTSVSFILCKNDEGDRYGDQLWPRTSQFIMLNEQADLLGGLLDFDLSTVTCSYDGTSVRVAPRAALSLMTNALFITPFCFEEDRNKRRVTKYTKRGFKPLLVDPHDNNTQQEVACDAKILRRPFSSTRVSTHPYGDRDEEYRKKEEVLRIQSDRMSKQDRIFCCHFIDNEVVAWCKRGSETLTAALGHDSLKLYRYMGIMYTQKLFETSEGDAIDFFSKRFEWNNEEKERVSEIDPYLRMACRRCKNEYGLVRIVMKQFPELMKEYEVVDDNLRGDFSHRAGYDRKYPTSFYSGGCFDSTLARDNARTTIGNVTMLRSQTLFEMSAYVLKHGSPDGYKRRYVYDSDSRECNYVDSEEERSKDYDDTIEGIPGGGLLAALKKASITSLQEPKRPPIGLNPERFIERCATCQSWLIGNRYGSKYCQRCDTKPSASGSLKRI